LLILAILSITTVFLGNIVFKLAASIPGVILLICLLTKQARNYYFESQPNNRFFNSFSFIMLVLILSPVLFVIGLNLKSNTAAHDEYISYLIEKMGMESAVSAEGNGIIGQWYEAHNRLPESIDEFIFSDPGPETIEKEGITYSYFYLTSEEKERLKVFLKKKELTYQKNGEKSYTLCGVFKKDHIFGAKQDLNDNTNPYYHERGLNCFRKTIENDFIE
jgi:hypothetical protein